MRAVTTPQDMNGGYDEIAGRLIDIFEAELKKHNRNEPYYHVIATGEFPRKALDIVENTYLNAGWAKVICRTSSEMSERPGLTGLQLFFSK